VSDIDRVLRSNLKLRHLQLLIALDQFRHLGRASEFLSLTQPAVSKSLAEIERMFGLDLFTRSTRGTEPTAYAARQWCYRLTSPGFHGRFNAQWAENRQGNARADRRGTRRARAPSTAGRSDPDRGRRAISTRSRFVIVGHAYQSLAAKRSGFAPAGAALSE